MCSHSETLKISPLSVRDVWLPFQICQTIMYVFHFCFHLQQRIMSAMHV